MKFGSRLSRLRETAAGSIARISVGQDAILRAGCQPALNAALAVNTDQSYLKPQAK